MPSILLVGLGVAGVFLALVLVAGYTARRVERAIPPLGRYLEVNGARIHYVERGTGPQTLLMIHGLGGQARNFTYALVDRLADDFRVVVMERPGAGYSTRAAGAAAGPRAQAEIVAGVIRTLGLDRPLLVGHSLGGTVALATAVEYPELVSGLALVSPFTQVQERPPDVFAALQIASPLARAIVGWTVAIPVAIARRRATLDAIFGPDAVPDDYAVAGGGLLALRPTAFVSACTDLVAVRPDMPQLVARYCTLEMPLGVLFGRGDRILDPRMHGESMRKHCPGLRLELVDGGHMLPITAPDRVAAFVRRVAADARTGPPLSREHETAPPALS